MENLLGKTFSSKKPGLKVIVTEHSDTGFKAKALNSIGDIKKDEIIEYTTVGGFLSRFTEVPDEAAIALAKENYEQMKASVAHIISDKKSFSNTAILLRNGKHGIGIITTLQEQLKEAGKPYVILCGQQLMLHQRTTNTLAKLLANLLKEHSGKSIVFDDCDEFLQDVMCQQLLMAAIEKHFVYMTKSETISEDFNGKMIFVYNNPEYTLNNAVLSRCYLFNL
jgi:hypothetical protein